MAIRLSTSFAGIERARHYPRQPIMYTSMDTVASDQGYVMEKLTNVSAVDGTTTPPDVNTGHDHTEDGNVIYKPLLTQSFGCSDGSSLTFWEAGTIEQRPYTIAPNSGTTPLNSVRLMSMIFFVPAMYVDKTLILAMDCEGTPRWTAAVYDSTLTLVGYRLRTPSPLWETTEMYKRSGAQSHHGFTFSVSSAGAYVIDIHTNLPVDEWGDLGFKILSVSVVPEIDPRLAGGYQREPADVAASNTITVGDPDNSNAWHPIDSVFTASTAPLGTGVMLMANNNAWLYEKATGVVAPGNATATVGGHGHETGAGGAMIEQSCGAWCFGGSFMSSVTEVYGNNSRAPIPAAFGAPSTEYFRTRIYMPASSDTSKLKCWVLVGGETSKSGTFEVVVAVGGSTQTFTNSTGTSADPAYLTVLGGTAFASYSGNSVNVVTIKIRLTAAAGTPNNEGYARLFGICLGLDP